LGSLNTIINQRNYNFSDITLSASGIEGVVNVRQIWYTIGDGMQIVYPRAWPWFSLFALNTPVPVAAAPFYWSQFAQGASPPVDAIAVNSTYGGSFYLDPPPDRNYQLIIDCTCYPVDLVDNSTVEAIPYLWTDAVPFYAAWYALLSSQMQARRQDAEAYYGYYQMFVQRARAAANPDILSYQYQGSTDPTQLNKFGLSPRASGGGNAQ
jgi:hypothetical protein